MVHATALLAAGLSGLAAASPVTERTNGKHVVHQFEDAPHLPLISLTPSGKYKELNYKGFFYVDTGIGGEIIVGVKASSPPTVITSGDLQSTVDGPPSISVEGTNTKYFDFESFNFACASNTAAVALAGLPESCSVHVVGHDRDGKRSIEETFHYEPESLREDMKHIVLPDGFRSLTKLEFHTTGELEVDIADLMDDLAYTIYN